MFDNNASAAAATVDFLNLIDWTFADWLSAIFQLNISNDLNSIKSFLSVWILVVIFWACCFKRRARCKLCKRNIVISASRNYWLRKLLISSVCCVLKSVSSSTIWWRDFSVLREFISRLSIQEIWVLINSSSSFISFKIWSDEFVIINYVSSSFLRKIEAIRIVKL